MNDNPRLRHTSQHQAERTRRTREGLRIIICLTLNRSHQVHIPLVAIQSPPQCHVALAPIAAPIYKLNTPNLIYPSPVPSLSQGVTNKIQVFLSARETSQGYFPHKSSTLSPFNYPSRLIPQKTILIKYFIFLPSLRYAFSTLSTSLYSKSSLMTLNLFYSTPLVIFKYIKSCDTLFKSQQIKSTKAEGEGW